MAPIDPLTTDPTEEAITDVVAAAEDEEKAPQLLPSFLAYNDFLEDCLAGSGDSRTTSSIQFLSDDVKTGPCMLGIDEAGRGPVLGPMLYACAIASTAKSENLRGMGLADSKQLTEGKREELLEKMLANADWIAYSIHSISPMEITEKMLSNTKISLNVISQNAAIGLIHSALDQGVNLKEVYVDTVGKAETYQAYLQSLFPKIKITVESKADDTYPIVSAASIFAKVTRDRLLARWPKAGRGVIPPNTPIGSGYPGDPLTKQYLRMCMDPIFGFPPLVRSSWSTAQALLEERAVRVLWEDDEDSPAMEAKKRSKKRQEEHLHAASGSAKISGFFKTETAKHDFSKRQPFFLRAGLSLVTDF
ncbi:hypothetical protein AAHC03_0617 [Spirometra sp. Aus1]